MNKLEALKEKIQKALEDDHYFYFSMYLKAEEAQLVLDIITRNYDVIYDCDLAIQKLESTKKKHPEMPTEEIISMIKRIKGLLTPKP